jgi:hypothetical protein
MNYNEAAAIKTLKDTGKVLVSKESAESFLKACWNEGINVNFEKRVTGILFTKK